MISFDFHHIQKLSIGFKTCSKFEGLSKISDEMWRIDSWGIMKDVP